MTSRSLWPTSIGASPSQRTMAEMLYDAAGDLGTITNGKLDFYVDAIGVAPTVNGAVTDIRYNCYIRVITKSYLHLFFQVTTQTGSPFVAELGTPEGEKFSDIKNEQELLQAIEQVMQRPRTKEVIDYLLRIAIS